MLEVTDLDSQTLHVRGKSPLEGWPERSGGRGGSGTYTIWITGLNHFATPSLNPGSSGRTFPANVPENSPPPSPLPSR